MPRESTQYSPYISGERLYLREVRISDVNENYYRWMNDPAVTRFLESRFYPLAAEDLMAYVRTINADRMNVFFALVLISEDRHIGNIKLGPINWIHRLAEIGILIGERDCWGKGYASEAINIVVKYAFQVLNLHKITAGCYGGNEGSIKAFQKAGFSIEGVRKQHFIFEDSYADLVLMGRLNTIS